MTFLLALTIGLLAFLLRRCGRRIVSSLPETRPLSFKGRPWWCLRPGELRATHGDRAVGPARRLDSLWPPLSHLASDFIISVKDLAIGAAFAAGAAGLGTFLMLGFTLHNVTEGIGIAAPILRQSTATVGVCGTYFACGWSCGCGIWIGSLAYAPQWSALALAIGAGAILQVIIEVMSMVSRESSGGTNGLLAPSALSGLAMGFAFMYGTAMLVKI